MPSIPHNPRSGQPNTTTVKRAAGAQPPHNRRSPAIGGPGTGWQFLDHQLGDHRRFRRLLILLLLLAALAAHSNIPALANTVISILR